MKNENRATLRKLEASGGCYVDWIVDLWRGESLVNSIYCDDEDSARDLLRSISKNTSMIVEVVA